MDSRDKNWTLRTVERASTGLLYKLKNDVYTFEKNLSGTKETMNSLFVDQSSYKEQINELKENQNYNMECINISTKKVLKIKKNKDKNVLIFDLLLLK